MAVMTQHNSGQTASAGADDPDLALVQFKLALELAHAAEGDVANRIAEAAATVGAELLFALPAPDGSGPNAIVRLVDEDSERLVQVRQSDDGLAVLEGDNIDPHLLSLARNSLTVLKQISDDPTVRALAKAN